MAQWYYLVNNEQQGPVSSDQLKQMAAAGTLSPETYVWREGLDDWKPAKMVQGLFGDQAAASPSPAAPQADPFAPSPAGAAPTSGYTAPTSYEPPPNTTPILVWSILATLCCCQPLGIAAIVFAAISMSNVSAGDMAAANKNARLAKTFAWIAFGLGLLFWLCGIGVNILSGFAQAGRY